MPARRPFTRPGNAVQRKQKKKQEVWRIKRTTHSKLFGTQIPSKAKFRKRLKKHGGFAGEWEKIKQKER